MSEPLKYRVDIVPKATPNADTRPIEVEVDFDPEKVRGWTAMARLLEPHVPTDHFMTGYARLPALTTPAPPSTVAHEPVPPGRKAKMSDTRYCQECSKPLVSTHRAALFCSPACRETYEKRRISRALAVYDLFMALRYMRPVAKQMKLWAVICTLASAFRQQDSDAREGRQSWRDPADVLKEIEPTLRASPSSRKALSATRTY